MLLIFILSLMLLVLILLSLTFILPLNLSSSSDFSSPFECGFNPMESSRLPFSLQFFLIAVIFLIFDVEITLLLPIPMISLMIQTTPLLMSFSIVMVILILGLFYEWNKGALNWVL